MGVPHLRPEDVEQLIPNCNVLGPSLRGGQKLVFPCNVNGEKCALKFILLDGTKDDSDGDGTIESKIDVTKARAEREISIMQTIDSPYVIKMGSVPLQSATINEQYVMYYSEEWIEGSNISELLRTAKTLPPAEVAKLCLDITQGISELWKANKIHRDIKPQNIMKRKDNGEYVLLDLGLAFDLDDKSLTQFGFVPGTVMFLSPEQLDISHKRDIDFRSDLFSLGIVLYQSLTGQHPFYRNGMDIPTLFNNIATNPVVPPIALDPTIPVSLNKIICRLLSKQPSGRYRKCSILINEIKTVIHSLEVTL